MCACVALERAIGTTEVVFANAAAAEDDSRIDCEIMCSENDLLPKKGERELVCCRRAAALTFRVSPENFANCSNYCTPHRRSEPKAT